MLNDHRPSTAPTAASRLGRFWALTLLLLSILIPGCASPQASGTKAPLDIAGVFPAEGGVPGWKISKKVATYTRDNLFDLVDGQANSFFVYGFEKAAVQRYQDEAGVMLNVEVWELADPADAYGLFTAGRSGEPAAIGNEGDADPGRRLAFWQNRYFVSLNAAQPVPDETLQAFARAVAGALPAGGEPPVILKRLPASGLVERSSIFFHEEMSIQMEVWLGGENILGLSPETNGVVAHYLFGDAPCLLMLIEYPTAEQSAQGLKALQNSGIANLIVSGSRGSLLGAVIGKVDAAQADQLLQEAIK